MRYLMIYAYTGECCLDAHVGHRWLTSKQAKNDKFAPRFVNNLEKKGLTVGQLYVVTI